MACRAIPMIAFLYICLWPLACYELYTKLRKLRRNNGRGAVKECTLELYRQAKESCVAYIETGTNS